MNPFSNLKKIIPADKTNRRVTMVLDKNMGLAALNDFVQTSSEYVSVVKFGWGSSMLYPNRILKEKIEILNQYKIDVCPGGTLSELAFDCRKFSSFLNEAKKLNFSCVEISNGINSNINISVKSELIKEAKNFGFKVFSEVGKKFADEDSLLSFSERIDEINSDLESGADKVIIEARESGTVGVYNEFGKVNSDLLKNFIRYVSPDKLIWEAPLKSQQVWLINELGDNVNLGNINPADVISLESLRRGIRADTFRQNMVGNITVTIDNGPDAAYLASKRNDIIVVFDSLRASNSIIACFEGNVKEVVPVLNLDNVQNHIMIGERGGKKIEKATFGNSPIELSKQNLYKKKVYISTTNGTECIKASFSGSNYVFIGSLRNASAVADLVYNLSIKLNLNISLITAGRNNIEAVEDSIAAFYVARKIPNSVLKSKVEFVKENNILETFTNSPSGRNLISLGYGEDIKYCCQVDETILVPYYDGKSIKVNE